MIDDKERIRQMNEVIIKSGKEFDEECRLNEKLEEKRGRERGLRLLSAMILFALVVYYHIY